MDPKGKIKSVDLVERIGPAEVAYSGGTTGDITPAHEALWSAWLQLTYHMLFIGFNQRSLCDTAGDLVTVTEEEKERATA